MRLVLSLSILVLAVGCGGSSSGGSSTTTDQVAILTIKSTGITTQLGNAASNIQMPNPGVIQFVNGDTVSHTIVASGGADCAPLGVGAIAAGTSTANITVTNNTASTENCTFNDSANAAIAGSVVLTLGAGGSGY